MKMLGFVLGAVLIAVMVAGNSNVHGLSLGTNITIFDEGVSGGNAWWNRTDSSGKYIEDQEVEPNCLTGQAWDLEGFFIDSTLKKLFMVGGYDFKNGYQGYESGDIFVGRNPVYGTSVPNPPYNGNDPIGNDKFKYDYALRLHFNTGTYDLIYLHYTASTLLEVYYGDNNEANPWKYKEGGTVLSNHGTFIYHEKLDDNEVGGLQGGNDSHYVVEISFSGLPFGVGSGLYYHFTYRCGNDNLMGKDTTPAPPPVPEPATIFLLGSGLIGIAALGRRKFSKSSSREI